MLISDSHRFAFFHNPKTGGSSITAALAPYLRDPQEVWSRDDRGWQIKHHVRIAVTIRGRVGLTSKKALHRWGPYPEGYLRVAFVRNPWERMVSWFLTRRDKTEGEEFDIYLSRFFRKYKTQSQAIGHADFVGRFEDLEQDFRRLCSQVGIDPAPELPHRNRQCEVRLPWRQYYRDFPGTEEMVRKHFAEDIERYGY